MSIKTESLVKALGSRAEIARFYGCVRQSVNDWGENIPELREYQLKERRPDIYDGIQHGKYE